MEHERPRCVQILGDVVTFPLDWVAPGDCAEGARSSLVVHPASVPGLPRSELFEAERVGGPPAHP